MLMTAPGAAAIAVVRLHGGGVAGFLGGHFSRPAVPSRCVHGELRDGKKVIDDPVVVLGDDGLSADVNLHGGPWVVASALDLLRREGFEVIGSTSAGPLPPESVSGETLLAREVLAYLPLART